MPAGADANHQRAAEAGTDDRSGFMATDDREAVGAADDLRRPGDRRDQIPRPESGEEVGEHLGVGVGAEDDAVILELLSQLEIVFDDTVVDHREVPGSVEMRVGVALRGRTVRRPAGVADPAGAGQRFVVECAGQRGDSARPPADVDSRVIDRRDARAVVAAVLEAPQALEEDRDDVERTGERDDAAHGRVLWGAEGRILRTDRWSGGRLDQFDSRGATATGLKPQPS